MTCSNLPDCCTVWALQKRYTNKHRLKLCWDIVCPVGDMKVSNDQNELVVSLGRVTVRTTIPIWYFFTREMVTEFSWANTGVHDHLSEWWGQKDKKKKEANVWTLFHCDTFVLCETLGELRFERNGGWWSQQLLFVQRYVVQPMIEQRNWKPDESSS